MTTEPLSLEAHRSGLGAVVAAVRPHQWTKNLLLFAGIIFAGNVGVPESWAQSLVAFAAYCLLSSAGYVVNDVYDVEHDRLHAVKRFRPIASGELSTRDATLLAAGLGIAGLGIAAALGLDSLLLAAAFLCASFVYTRWLKHVYLVDVLVIAGLFVARAAAGAVAVEVRISSWLLVCTALLAMFLSLAKRRGEILATGDDPSLGRAVLRHYSLRRLGRLVWSTATGVLIAYAVYAFSAHDSREMIATVPFVGFGLARYLFLMQRYDVGEEPDRVLLTDPPILLAVALWGVAAAVILNAA
jgi:4-hydroxybenzoate polyprenyltransferase